jgi:hypothetical protein
MKSDFSVREHADPNASADSELFFRIREVPDRDHALARALEIYDLGRREVGLSRDYRAEPSLVPAAPPTAW